MRTIGLRFLGHSTVRLDIGDQAVLTDPILTERVGHLRRVTRALAPADIAGVDLVLLSHLHSDHLHLPSLRRLPPKTRVVVPRGAGSWLHSKGVRQVVELAPGETMEHRALTITGTKAVHSGYRWGPRLEIGPQAKAMGHVIEGAEVKVYAAGDTDLFPEMAELTDIDLALLPVWGWGPSIGPGHMNPKRAAEAVAMIKPQYAVPVHWGTLSVQGLHRMPGQHGSHMRRMLKEPPQEFAHAVTGDTRVVVLQPGEAETFIFH